MDTLAHRLWIRKQREKYPKGRKGTEDWCPCENCHCVGNRECGREPLDKEKYCTLDSHMVCPCCAKEGDPATDAEYDKAVGQEHLF